MQIVIIVLNMSHYCEITPAIMKLVTINCNTKHIAGEMIGKLFDERERKTERKQRYSQCKTVDFTVILSLLFLRYYSINLYWIILL